MSLFSSSQWNGEWLSFLDILQCTMQSYKMHSHTFYVMFLYKSCNSQKNSIQWLHPTSHRHVLLSLTISQVKSVSSSSWDDKICAHIMFNGHFSSIHHTTTANATPHGLSTDLLAVIYEQTFLFCIMKFTLNSHCPVLFCIENSPLTTLPPSAQAHSLITWVNFFITAFLFHVKFDSFW